VVGHQSASQFASFRAFRCRIRSRSNRQTSLVLANFRACEAATAGRAPCSGLASDAVDADSVRPCHRNPIAPSRFWWVREPTRLCPHRKVGTAAHSVPEPISPTSQLMEPCAHSPHARHSSAATPCAFQCLPGIAFRNLQSPALRYQFPERADSHCPAQGFAGFNSDAVEGQGQ